MVAEQALCPRCGRPFVPQKLLRRIVQTATENALDKYQPYLTLCPRCRSPFFAERLVGSELRKVPRVRHVAKRRREQLKPVKVDARLGTTVYKSECYFCNQGCDAVVHVKDGKVVKVEGDVSSSVTKGILCSKGLASKEVLYHPDRLLYPMKRSGERGENKWQRISWDEALDTIARRFKETEARYGKYSVILATGTNRGWPVYFDRFANAYGRQWVRPGVAQCAWPRWTGGRLVTGSMAMENPDFQHTDCLLIWGANPSSTWAVKGLGVMEAWSRGSKIIVVDPVFTELAAKADIWLCLRPGTDAALALGMLNVIINEELYDREFVDKWCVGFEDLRQRVQQYPPEKVEEITWIAKDKVIAAARMYATTKPASVTQCVAIDQNADTISTSRSIAMLAAITGNIDVPGGNLINMPVKVRPEGTIGLAEKLTQEDHEQRLGSKDYPLLSGEACLLDPAAHNATMWKAILTGQPYPVRALFCEGSNMVVAYANSKKVIAALAKLDFIAVADFFMTATAEIADIVLPAATWMERDAVTYQHQTSFYSAHLQQKVAQLGECWSDWKIMNELAKRLGFAGLMFPTDEAYFDFLLEPSEMTFAEFRKVGLISVPLTFQKYEQGGFKTPSGKIELYSQKLKDLGFDPLPGYREPEESPIGSPGLAKEYPLILTTGGRVPVFRHSELRNIAMLREIMPDLLMTINTNTARELGITNGETVLVESPRGSMEARAYLTEGIDPRVVQIPSHWPGKNNVNLLMDDEHCAPMIGSNHLRCQLCRVKKKR